MPTCTRCGERNPDNATACSKCNVSFGSQMRSQAGMARHQTGNVVRIGIWIAVVVALAIAALPAYHAANAYYQKFHYESITANATESCGGPITANMPSYQVAQVNDCLAKNEDLLKAKSDYAAFKNSEKH